MLVEAPGIDMDRKESTAHLVVESSCWAPSEFGKEGFWLPLISGGYRGFVVDGWLAVGWRLCAVEAEM